MLNILAMLFVVLQRAKIQMKINKSKISANQS